MGYAIVNLESEWAGEYSNHTTNLRPLLEGESVVECDWDAENNRPVGVTMPSPQPVVQQISRRQGRLLLHNMGLLAQVEAAVTEAGTVAQIFYESEVWLRSDTFVNSLGPQLGLTSAQLDDMFNAASLL
jgi:hypothetical protein